MRITRVVPIVLRLPEVELRADGTQGAFIVRIETDEGLFGIGEAEAARAVVARGAAPGRRPGRLRAALRALGDPHRVRCGGFTQARRIAALTYEKNRAMVPHAFSTGILVAASLHMTAAMPHGTLTEFSVADGPLVRDLLQDPFTLEPDGTVRVPTAPGLGIELDERVVERFRVV